VILDASPVGLAGKAPGKEPVDRCLSWIKSLRSGGNLVAVPEIARYEVRRELIRLGATASLRRLDALHPDLAYLPITRMVMERAAELWAHVRRAGLPTSPREALDGDAIRAAQALIAVEEGVDGEGFDRVLIATTNAAHLNRFPGVFAQDWWPIA